MFRILPHSRLIKIKLSLSARSKFCYLNLGLEEMMMSDVLMRPRFWPFYRRFGAFPQPLQKHAQVQK